MLTAMRTRLVLFVTTLALAGSLVSPFLASAQELLVDTTTIVKARVVEILSTGVQQTGEINSPMQKINVQIVSGAEKGKFVVLSNDYVQLKQGERFYVLTRIHAEDGSTTYTVSEPNRLPALAAFFLLFIILVVAFGGIQGIRGLLSLAGSLFVIMYMLLPGILHAYSPILISLGAASLIVVLGSYVTHGFNRTTTSAVLGMVATIVVTGFLAWIAVSSARLTGFSNEEAMYLNFNTQGTIDFVGLLLGGILIGLLGVLYDVAISQAIAVEELNRVAPHLPRGTIFSRAIRIGREHIGALVNTLAIAYVGSSLPLLLLYLTGPAQSTSITLNQEIFSAEIIRILIGSIGLVLAVPITTMIAARMVVKGSGAVSEQQIHTEREALEGFEHHH